MCTRPRSDCTSCPLHSSCRVILAYGRYIAFNAQQLASSSTVGFDCSKESRLSSLLINPMLRITYYYVSPRANTGGMRSMASRLGPFRVELGGRCQTLVLIN
jgi:hypothetical protein